VSLCGVFCGVWCVFGCLCVCVLLLLLCIFIAMFHKRTLWALLQKKCFPNINLVRLRSSSCSYCYLSSLSYMKTQTIRTPWRPSRLRLLTSANVLVPSREAKTLHVLLPACTNGLCRKIPHTGGEPAHNHYSTMTGDIHRTRLVRDGSCHHYNTRSVDRLLGYQPQHDHGFTVAP